MQASTAATRAELQPPRVVFKNITKNFRSKNGDIYTALDGVDLEVPAGKFVAIVGPSGCGKSTLLRMLSGLDRPTSGEVMINDQRVAGVMPQTVGFLQQQDTLLPWKTVFENIALGLRFRKTPAEEIKSRVEDWLRKVNLYRFRNHYPAQLSGGMRRRVAIAQTLILDPPLLLMDEPFSSLDAQTRYMMEMDLLSLAGSGERTIVFVTHDLDEAASMADTVVVLAAGPHSRVKAIVDVDIERPRDLLAIRSDPRFGQITRFLWDQLYEEVNKSYGK